MKNKTKRKMVGIRLEDRMAKTILGISKGMNIPQGELIERVFFHAIRGSNYFGKESENNPDLLKMVKHLEQAYGVDKVRNAESL